MTNIMRYGEMGGVGRAPSARLWQGVNLRDLEESYCGQVFSDDFQDLPTGRYTASQQNSKGTFALDSAKGGVALADSDSDVAASDGISVQAGGAAGAAFIPSATDTIWFEGYLKASDIATGPEFFFGLSSIDTSIIVSSANTSINHIGFESVSDDNVVLFHSEKAGTRTSSTQTIHTLVDGATTTDGTEWVRLGFMVIGLSKIQVFVDGKIVDTLTTNIPIVEMAPSLCCQSNAATDPMVHLDWWRCAQKFG